MYVFFSPIFFFRFVCACSLPTGKTEEEAEEEKNIIIFSPNSFLFFSFLFAYVYFFLPTGEIEGGKGIRRETGTLYIYKYFFLFFFDFVKYNIRQDGE